MKSSSNKGRASGSRPPRGDGSKMSRPSNHGSLNRGTSYKVSQNKEIQNSPRSQNSDRQDFGSQHHDLRNNHSTSDYQMDLKRDHKNNPRANDPRSAKNRLMKSSNTRKNNTRDINLNNGIPKNIRVAQPHQSQSSETVTENSTELTQKQIDPRGEKLHKILSRSGIGSRRKIEQMIEQKRISVNGSVAQLGDRLEDMSAQVRIDGHQIHLISSHQSICRVLAYNKDEGEICTRHDPEGRKTIYDRLPLLKEARWIAVGRLDINTSGLILFTTDGELANQLMHPSRQIEREYSVRIFGEVTEQMVKNLVDGVNLEDGFARFEDVVYAGGEGNHHNFYVVIAEGRNREVRRLWESQGVLVSRLKRVRYGSIVLDKMLPKSGWMELSLDEVNYLRELTSLTHERISLLPARARDVNPRHKKQKIARAIRRHVAREDTYKSDKRSALRIEKRSTTRNRQR